jgi:glycosyltransferase involved in cell wall biosynthesis
MLSIKYWSPFFDASGYASCSRHYIKALVDGGADVTLSPVSFEEARPDLGDLGNKYILKNVNRQIDYQVNLIHLTPEHYPMYREPGKVNVGYTVWETGRIHHDWVNYCNCMDAIIVPSEWNVTIFKNSGVKVPVYCVPHVIDIKRFDNVKKFVVDGPAADDYIFYSVFQFMERKDPISLLKAYWYAFNSTDNVALVLKTYKNNYSDSERNGIIQTIKNLKQSILMPKGNDFAPVYLVLDMLSDEEILGLHKYGDCFVSLNRGEGFGLPEAEAVAAGNPVIVTGYGGVNQFLNNSNSYLLDYTLTPVSGVPMLWYTFDQWWAQANVLQAGRIMNFVYEDKEGAKQKGSVAQKNIKDNFSYDFIGKLYIQILEEIVLGCK